MGRPSPDIVSLLTVVRGDVRIAPNELVFFTPQALAGMHYSPRIRQVQGLIWRTTDLCGSHERFLEIFPKTQINNHENNEHGGLIWEWDPVRHRQVAKQLSPAFSGRALKVKELTIHKYVDLFVERMEALGEGENGQGVNLPKWINWIVSISPLNWCYIVPKVFYLVELHCEIVPFVLPQLMTGVIVRGYFCRYGV